MTKCRFNSGIDCTKPTCDTCGFSPTREKKRPVNWLTVKKFPVYMKSGGVEQYITLNARLIKEADGKTLKFNSDDGQFVMFFPLEAIEDLLK